jgi:L-cysteine/cystine lyase
MALRAALPAVASGIYLNAGTAGPLPAETAAAMAELAGWELRTGRAHAAFYEEALGRLDELRAVLAAVLTGDVDEIAILTSTSHAMAVATWAVDWERGDVAVTTTLEHAGGLGPLYALRDRLAVDLRFVDPRGDDEATLAAFDRAIAPGTRLVSLSHVAWSTGALLPVRRIAELAHARGATVVVDGAQAAGAIPLDVPSLGVDLYAVPGQKWLLGPEGIAGLWVAPAFLDRARLTMPGYTAFETLDAQGRAVAWPSARRFDAANVYKPAIVGLARSVGWLAMYVGLDWLYERAGSLARATVERLAAIDGVEVLTPVDRMATLITFRIGGWTAQAALDELGARVFAIARTIPSLDALRISVGAWNTAAELERFIGAVALLAAHSPEDLPAKRTLEVLGEGPA